MNVREDRHKVRISFKHGNPISLNLKGCGNLYIQPYRDYFFENAPIQFINYLSQLRRLGVTYRLTSDKKGCFMTVDLTAYNSNDPREMLTKLRSNKIVNPPKITRPSSINYKSDVVEEKIEDEHLVSQDSDIKEITLDKVKEAIENAQNENATINKPESESVISDEEKVTELTTDTPKEKLEVTKEEIETMSKSNLIDLAKSLNIQDASELWTKKELRSAILDKLSL